MSAADVGADRLRSSCECGLGLTWVASMQVIMKSRGVSTRYPSRAIAMPAVSHHNAQRLAGRLVKKTGSRSENSRKPACRARAIKKLQHLSCHNDEQGRIE